MSFAMITCGGKDDKKDTSSKSGNNGWSAQAKDSVRKELCAGFNDYECRCIVSKVSEEYSFKDYSSKIFMLNECDALIRDGKLSPVESQKMYEKHKDLIYFIENTADICEGVEEDFRAGIFFIRKS